MDLAREPNFRLGTMEVRPSTREIVFAGDREVLEPRVMAVLIALARAAGEVVTREDLTDACWDGRIVSDDAVNRVISRVRRVSDLTGNRDFTLETITKVGYRLVTAPQAATEAAPAPLAAGTGAPPSPHTKKRPTGIIAVLATLVVVIAAGAWWTFGREPDWTDDPKASLTLAVLPFDNLGTDESDDPLAVGMAREIRNTLSRVRGLRVVSDSSSFAVAAENLGAEEMARRLNADYLLDGSLARTGDTVKLSAELVDAWSGTNLWTGSQEGPAADLDRVRQMMSAAVFEQLVARIGPKRVEILTPPKPSDPRVYRLTLEAQEQLRSQQSMRMYGEAEAAYDAGDRAYGLVQQALAIDPNAPLALTTMAWITNAEATRDIARSGMSITERQSRAADFLRRALASDPDTVPALEALGEHYRRSEWRWADAKALLERALALDPNRSDSHLSYGYYLSGVGRCIEALEHSLIATEVDPEFGWRTLGVPRALKCLGLYEEADKLFLQSLANDRGNLFILREIYLDHFERGEIAWLRSYIDQVRGEIWNNAPPATVQKELDRVTLAIDALEGRPGPFLALIESDIEAIDGAEVPQPRIPQGRRLPDAMWTFAIELAWVGETQRAIDLLERAVAGGSLYIPETMPYGAYEFTPEMRADPRYQAIWNNDPRLVELKRLRLEGVKARQMAGVLPDGTKIRPKERDLQRVISLLD